LVGAETLVDAIDFVSNASDDSKMNTIKTFDQERLWIKNVDIKVASAENE